MTDAARMLAGLLAGALLIAPAMAQAPTTISVQAGGELPGFLIQDAAPYLAAQMAAAAGKDWHFVARDMAAAAPNRIEWTFEVLPYAGGQVRQFFPMPGVQRLLGAHRLISAQARLYLGGEFQTMTFGQETVQGGAGDPELAAFLVKLTRSLETAWRATDMTPAAHSIAKP